MKRGPAAPLAWLESLGQVTIDHSMGRSRACLTLGRFHDVRVQIWCDGRNAEDALLCLSAKVEKILDQGHVRL
jgi:hypothetical protein